MKLHINRKNGKNIKRALSMLLVLSLVFSGGSSYAANTEEGGTADEGHRHGEGCYEKVLVCGLEEQTENGAEQTLTCMLEETEGHSHTEDCYPEQGEPICGMEEQEPHDHEDSCYETAQTGHIHTEDCWQEVLVCDQEEGSRVVSESETEAGNSSETGEPEQEDAPEGDLAEPETEEVQPVPSSETVSESADKEETGSEEAGNQETPSGEAGNQETPSQETPSQEDDWEFETETDQAAEAVSEQMAAVPTPEEIREMLAGCEEDREAWYHCLGQLGEQMREACRAWLELDEAQRGQAEGIQVLLGRMKFRKEIEDAFLERSVYCGKESHVHMELEGCYDENGSLSCADGTHIHLEGIKCHDEEGNLICGKEEHIHKRECFLIPGATQEEQLAAERAAVLIADMSSAEEIREELDACKEEAKYRERIAEAESRIREAEEACGKLREECREYICNLEKLAKLRAALEEWKAQEPAQGTDEDSEASEENVYCGKKAHVHTEECVDESGQIVCGKEEHTHDLKCSLTEEEQKAVQEVNLLIAGLPSEEEITEKLGQYEEAGEEDAYAAYMIALMQQVAEAVKAYRALPEEQQQYVEGTEYLFDLEALLSVDALEDWEIMGPDEAYVSEITVTGMETGSAPFDETSGRGNDTTANDRLVRTFDAVTYNFNVNMKSWDASKTYGEARVKLEFVLPLNETEAVFEQTAMAWMDQTDGYKPVVTTEMRLVNGGEKECQVLTCYKHLLPSEGNYSVVPGEFGENLTIYVRSMKNGEKFAPIISAAMEGGAWDGPCDKTEHQINGAPGVEKRSVTPEEVEVTAAPKYNIQVSGNASYADEFHFQGDQDWMAQYGETAANTDIVKPLPGRSMVLGITLQLYNDNASKGLKGIELPDGSDITFDLKVSSTYKINTPNEGYQEGQVIENISEYMPLLWSYNEVTWRDYGAWNKDGRQIDDRLKATPYAPYTAGGGETACYRGGSWTAAQEGDTIHITVSGYEIDPKQMPGLNADGGTTVAYGANVGCFSSGEIWLIQPFNKKEGEGTKPNYDIVNAYGPGAFATTVEAGNLKVTTVSGDRLVQGENGFQQMVQADDRETRTLELTLEGGLQNRVRYADGNVWELGCGVMDNRDGRDFAAVGTEINLMGGLSYNPNREQQNQMYLGTTLLKFYGTALEIGKEEWFLHLEGGATLNGYGEDEIEKARENVRFYYAVKKDGSDWLNDEELKRTYEDSLDFYDSLDQIPAGKTCVGMLICFIGPGSDVKTAQDPYYRCYHKATVRDNMALAGQTFMLASTSRVWTKGMLERLGMSSEDIDLTKHPDLNVPELILQDTLWECGHYTSANIEGSVFYDKETYWPDGSGIKGTHNSDWYHWGDTLLVIGYKTAITKNLLQKDENNEEKKTFNLDAEQRVADFVLQPKSYYDQTYYDKPVQTENKANITIVDTLPQHMTYKPGSAYFGGRYEQTSSLGGTRGNIIRDDTPGAQFPDPVLTEPVVTRNADGTQTLTWVIFDVKIGEPMAAIYYSADIGVKGNPSEDISQGTKNLTNQVYITTPLDLRDPETTAEKHAEAGITVTRGSASSFGKYTKQKVVDEDGEIDYVVYFNNNAETAAAVAMMDTMPMNQVSGSHFTGTYTFAEWKLDTSRCDVQKLEIYYTFDRKYENATTSTVGPEEMRGWKKAAIGQDGSIAIPTAADGVTDEQPFPVAWAVVGDLDSHKSVNIELKIKLDPGTLEQSKTENNYFVNRLSSGDTTTITETPTVRRTLEGLTWMDYNRDGVQDDSQKEIRVSGIRVELLKLKDGCDPEDENSYESVTYPGTADPIAIETGQQISVRAGSVGEAVPYDIGRYKFTDLPAGTFAVRFTDGSGQMKLTELNATKQDSGPDDTRDSDGEPVYDNDGKLEKTVILNLMMPKAEEMSVSLYESRHHDSGFYPDTQMKIQKVDETGQNALQGAIFTIQDSGNRTMSFTYKEGEGYTPVAEEKSDPSLEGKYYIAFAENPKYVVEIGGDWDGAVPVLQKRNGNSLQLFEIIEDGNGFKSFLNVGSGKWLDLDNGSLSNGAKIHVWSNNQPNDNQKWQVIDTDGGSYIQPSIDTEKGWCMDLSGGVPSAGGTIHLWEVNGSGAQKWVLIPAAGSTNEGQADAQTDLCINDTEPLTIRDLIPGDYTIREIKSPEGYSLLGRPLQFTMHTDGSISTNNDMAVLGPDEENGMVLKIRNQKLYTLPSTGGAGTGTYAAAGTLLMFCSLLYVFFNRKKRTA